MVVREGRFLFMLMGMRTANKLSILQLSKNNVEITSKWLLGNRMVARMFGVSQLHQFADNELVKVNDLL